MLLMTNQCLKCSGSFNVKPYRASIAKYCSYDCYWGKSSNTGQKECSGCKEVLAIGCFGTLNRGFNSKCRNCRNKDNRNYRRNIAPKERYRFYEWNSRRNNREFSISFDQFVSVININVCYYCGSKDERLGLDRVDSSVGYTLQNVVACCRRCNVAKNDMSQSDFIRLCSNVHKRHAGTP